MIDRLINIKQDEIINIRNTEYKVKTKTEYTLKEDESANYYKLELSDNKVLVVIPDDNLVYLGEVIDINYERIDEETIKYQNTIFSKTGSGNQIIKKIHFGDKEEVEDSCTFEDYESPYNIISLGILTSKNNQKADVYAYILDEEDIK